jgi:hypothetical protein
MFLEWIVHEEALPRSTLKISLFLGWLRRLLQKLKCNRNKCHRSPAKWPKWPSHPLKMYIITHRQRRLDKAHRSWLPRINHRPFLKCILVKQHLFQNKCVLFIKGNLRSYVLTTRNAYVLIVHYSEFIKIMKSKWRAMSCMKFKWELNV